MNGKSNCNCCLSQKIEEYREREIFELQKSHTDLQKRATKNEINTAINRAYIKIGLLIALGLVIEYIWKSLASSMFFIKKPHLNH